ncbi:YjbE family putative metal transport protein [Paenibacillus sp. HJL G12]|uniref:YjbE family putative metal transport protein n=1 Tax=Paenibacillus dendrobii TaxID=2691084 RepID=A0A7X3LJC5_9BACL|nr:TerC family protein [Paenibacillus dendrobii]MWV45259.1 YjbE family putative metal transport protein [Paenibacillus dendrobii]
MESIWLLMQILMINLVLSGDNAVVIALASKNLPPKQRKQAVWWGALGAVVLRCILTFAAVLLLKIPYVQAAGGILLFWIAFKLLADDKDDVRMGESASIWKAVRSILAADFIMSLDNVLALAGVANGDLALIVIGIAISIPIVVFGSNLIVGLLHRYPLLVYLGAGILGYTAGEMLLQDSRMGILLSSILPEIHRFVPALLTVLVIAAGSFKKVSLSRT